MEKDLRDAVLAAFDEDTEESSEGVEGEENQEESVAEEEEGEEASGEASRPGKSTKRAAGSQATKKAQLQQAAAASRAKRGVGRRSAKAAVPAEVEVEGKSGPAKKESLHTRRGKDKKEKAAAGDFRRLFVLSLCLNVAVVALLIVLMIRTAGKMKELRGALETIHREVVDTREVAKFSRIKLGTFMEPNKRPQAAIVVIEETDGGRLRLGKTVIRPLEKRQ